MDGQDYLKQVEALKEMLATQPMINKEQREKLWRKFRLDWGYHSNHLEGNTLTYEEIETLLLSDTVPGQIDAIQAAHIKAHDKAINIMLNEVNNRAKPLTEPFITQLNDRLGYTTPDPAALTELIAWYNNKKDADPVTLAATFYHRFLQLQKNNCRVARLLLCYILMKHDLPPVIITSSDPEAHTLALHAAAQNNMQPLIDLIASLLVVSLGDSIRAASGRATDTDAWKKKLQMVGKGLQ